MSEPSSTEVKTDIPIPIAVTETKVEETPKVESTEIIPPTVEEGETDSEEEGEDEDEGPGIGFLIEQPVDSDEEEEEGDDVSDYVEEDDVGADSDFNGDDGEEDDYELEESIIQSPRKRRKV